MHRGRPMIGALRRKAAWTSLVSLLLAPLPALAGEGAATPAFYGSFDGRSPSPGEWLAAEPLPPELGLPDAQRQLRFLYGSADATGKHDGIAVSGALFLPAGPAPAGGWPIVAWAHGTVGIADHCAPSVAGRSQRDLDYLGAWLSAGFAIVATDYQGLGTPGAHPYLNNRAAAYGILDSVRAARTAVPGLANRILIVGQSQGAAAAISAAALAPAYAPDLGIIGTVATGVPNVAASLGDKNRAERRAADFDPAVAYLLYLAASASEADPSLDPASVIQPRAEPSLDAAGHLCALPLLARVRSEGLTQDEAIRPQFFDQFAAALAAAQYPSLALAQPLFIGIGEADIDTPGAGQLQIADMARAAGTAVETHVYPGRDHSSAVNPSFRDSSAFAKRLLSARRRGRLSACRCGGGPFTP